MLFLRSAVLVLLVGVFTLAVGCGSGEEERITSKVEGKVTVAGKPLGKAGYTLSFDPENTKGTQVTVNEDGTYAGDAIPGKNTVTLSPPQAGSGSHDEGAGFQRQELEVKKGETTTQDLDFKK